ncbi:MAG: universal stress protein, partial [Alphaproteobacteria bacterium]
MADTVAEGLKESFLRYSAEHGLKVVEKEDGAGPSISWVEKEGKQVDVIKLYGRLSDLIIVAKLDRDKNLGTNTLKASLFNTGRPVLMCPDKETAPTTLGEHVAIAWNGSVESVRSVSLNMDILFNASAVTILTA